MRISAGERACYDRQIILREIGERGQAKLRAGSVLVVGAGGLGAPVLSYLVAAGVGRVGLIDDDVVQVADLQRQTLSTSGDIGRSKAECAAARLAALNPEVSLEAQAARFTSVIARRLVGATTDRVRGRQLPLPISPERRLRARAQDAGRRCGA